MPDPDPVLCKWDKDAEMLDDPSADDHVSTAMLSRKKRVLDCPDFTLRAGAPDGGTAPRGRTAVLCSTMPPTTPPTVCVCCPVVSGPAFKRGGLHFMQVHGAVARMLLWTGRLL